MWYLIGLIICLAYIIIMPFVRYKEYWHTLIPTFGEYINVWNTLFGHFLACILPVNLTYNDYSHIVGDDYSEGCALILLVILLGSLLLTLPISSANGKSVDYLDALFTATTSTCVTGLVTVPTYSTWSIFGQIIILILIQIGGLGVVAFMALFMIVINKKLRLKDNQLIQDAFKKENF